MLKYTDSEVRDFHPVCEKALKKSLRNLKLHKLYEIHHHKKTGKLEMDFVIQNKNTGKYLCVIEVKRKPEDLQSTRYQYQAMSYVQMNSHNNERPFYILTNLENALIFRYDTKKPKVYQQILSPGLYQISDFRKKKKKVEEDLTKFFSETIKSFEENTYEYMITPDYFSQEVEKIKNNKREWKTSLALMFYEYIRGAFKSVNDDRLRDIRLYNNDLELMCQNAKRINFDDIFNYNDKIFDETIRVDNDLLNYLYSFGEQNTIGDPVTNILHEIVSRGQEHNGEVPTDLELGRLMSILAKNNYGSLDDGELICDPAAGSGNLISSAIEEFKLRPTQVLVNDVNSKLLELLSLRLGLNFINVISPTNTIKISNKNIANLESSYFDDVKVLLLNPPFVAGINSTKRKPLLSKKIEELEYGNKSFDEGQMPFDAVFLKLLTLQTKSNTTIVTVFPKSHLVALGPEAVKIREFLIKDFGLNLIFNYPRENVFDDVTKDTCVLVGNTNNPSDEVVILNAIDKIPEIDSKQFKKVLNEPFGETFESIIPGIEAKSISNEKISNNIETGWRFLNSDMIKSIEFIEHNIVDNNMFNKLNTEENLDIKRGRGGNNGGSDLIFFDKNRNYYAETIKEELLTIPAIRNSTYSSFLIDEGDSRFIDLGRNDTKTIDKVIDVYIDNSRSVSSKQKKKEKNRQDWITILEKEFNNVVPAKSILIPRAIRGTGKVFLSLSDLVVSTNFIRCRFSNLSKTKIISTWMNTIFYQLICEVNSKDQEGMRKMELNEIMETYIPDYDSLSDKFITTVINELDSIEFLNLRNPSIRNIDLIWAKELFPNNYEYMLDTALDLLTFQVKRRNP